MLGNERKEGLDVRRFDITQMKPVQNFQNLELKKGEHTERV